MSDMPCIYEMSLINENDSLTEDILKGNALDILLVLLSGSKTIKELSRVLEVPAFSLKLYVQRLVEKKLIKVTEIRVTDGKIEKTYELASTDVKILNCLKNSCKSQEGKVNIDLSAQHFSSLTKEVIKNIEKYNDKPHKIRAYFIKADEDKMIEFREELDKLFEKYQEFENLDALDTYGFITVFAPYKLESKE